MLTALLTSALLGVTAGQSIEVGSAFPDFELPTIDGSQTVRLSELRGQRVLLVEFASW